ncbi:hypothetical protein [Sinosporangium album]|nr:hypothetical protein [Sinosporangium album]
MSTLKIQIDDGLKAIADGDMETLQKMFLSIAKDLGYEVETGGDHVRSLREARVPDRAET